VSVFVITLAALQIIPELAAYVMKPELRVERLKVPTAIFNAESNPSLQGGL
jgi:hypothetical protein